MLTLRTPIKTHNVFCGIPYRTKLSRTKVMKFWLGYGNLYYMICISPPVHKLKNIATEILTLKNHTNVLNIYQKTLNVIHIINLKKYMKIVNSHQINGVLPP